MTVYVVQLSLKSEAQETLIIDHEFENRKTAEDFYNKLHNGIVYQYGVKNILELLEYEGKEKFFILHDEV